MKGLTRFLLLLFGCGAGWVASCTAGSSPSETTPTSAGGTSLGGGGSGATGGLGGTGGFVPQGGAGQVFPSEPILDGTAPAESPSLFGDPAQSTPTGGPCLLEPEPEALFPRNWLRPRFRFAPGGTENLFELRFAASSQLQELVVYTDQPTWTMPPELWTAVALNVVAEPITVTVRGALYEGGQLVGAPSIGSVERWSIAPTEAAGSIVYWWTLGVDSGLKGFSVGEESVVAALAPADVEMPTASGAPVTCIGCHTSTPDGKLASFVAQAPWANAIASIEPTTVGATPSFLTPEAIQMLATPELGIHTYSDAHWADGDRIQITPRGAFASAELAWIDLEASSTAEGVGWGILARNGDSRGVGSPAWSHDGQNIVYVSTDAQTTGRLDVGPADLYFVPYNDKLGGNAAPIPGASASGVSEYYPTLSPDDSMLAFTSIPEGGNMYDAPMAEVHVLRWPGGTGTPVRLAANDPPACSGITSPGITNSWPKWAPEVGLASGTRYYWIIFSSRRHGATPQLYMTGVELSAINEVTTHGAVYLWNQPPDESNHTPAWDAFAIPPAE
jgi:mono/diheme cytochrome c family protein